MTTEPLVVNLSLTLEQAALIVRMPSGVHYTNQTGGTSCHHPEAEGVLVPLEDENSWFQKQLEAIFEPAGATVGRSGLTTATADALDELLRGQQEISIRVDRARLLESEEAWVYVHVHPRESELPIMQGFGVREAVLTWLNSD
ncbi:DUF6210 family protein [Deinococcus pimensis]|uniref:DUF6210 family protein n=1 Tax=Deinococcus pimensis TaxID=309888 RepID=UPI0004B6F0C4|nr:DUF6210 family protein [Deinococcus pimensis]